MIDLHNHILPGVDDGAVDMRESVAIAQQFVTEGVRQIAATPHLDPLRGTGPGRETVERLVADVQSAIEDAGVELVVVPGQEIFLTPDVPALFEQGDLLPLGDSRAVLVECSLDQRPLYLDDTLFRLQLAGLQPVLAHPERYSFVQRDVATVDGLVDRGVVLQLTAPALLGEYGGTVRRTAERLLLRGSYAIGSSDRHHPGRERSLSDLHNRIEELVGMDVAELLLRTNPRRLLDGQSPLPVEPAERKRPSLASRLLRRRA
jgi:protein-tyrosine phosphatase